MGKRVDVGEGVKVIFGVGVATIGVSVAVGRGVWVIITNSDSSSDIGVSVGGGPIVGRTMVGVSDGKNSSIGALQASIASRGRVKNSSVLLLNLLTVQPYHLQKGFPTEFTNLFDKIPILLSCFESLR